MLPNYQTINFIFLVVTASCLLPIHGGAAPLISMRTDHYVVNGDTVEEIRDDMDLKSPVHANGIAYDAHTSWVIKWDFRWSGSRSICRIKDLQVRVKIGQIIPKLSNLTEVPETVAEIWKYYKKALLEHEEEHKEIALTAAAKIEQIIADLPPGTNCNQLVTEANLLANQVLEKYKFIGEELDYTTDHGMKYGAVFP